MVRTVVGDEAQLNSTETQLSESRILVQVGIVIGRLGGARSNRDSVFALIPTPHNEGVDPAYLTSENAESRLGRGEKKKGSKGKSTADSSSLVIDVDWVGEHARQVSKMLLGGLHVVGIYVWANENSFKNSSLVLWQTLKAIATGAPVYENGESDERLLIHISYSPRRWLCRSCNLDANFTSMSFRPCELKMTKAISTLQTFSSVYSFEVRLPVYREDSRKTSDMRKILLKAVSLQAEQLKCAKALINGSLVTEDNGSIAGGPNEIDLLLPFSDDNPVQAGSNEEVVGLVVFSGTIYAQAYTSSREQLSQAIADLKGDIISSLKSRLEILCDEAEQASASVNSGENRAPEDASLINQGHPLFSCDWSEPCNFVFPRRVLVPWLDGIFICDYLQPTETFEDLAERCEELMSMKNLPDPSTILEPEPPGTTSIGRSFWSIVASANCTQGKEDSRELGKDTVILLPKPRIIASLHAVIAVGIVILAMLIAFALLVVGPRTTRHV
eukprot:Gb_15498 [translate_table: standard]